MASSDWNKIDNVEAELPLYYCVFLDILGYKEKSKLFFTNMYNLPGRIERALNTISISNLFTSLLVDTSNISVESFSDSIIILKPVDRGRIAPMLNFALAFIGNLTIEGLLVRGGVAMGKHHDRRGSTGFRALTSEALQKAYLLENTQAKMPRVLIDAKVISVINSQEHSAEEKAMIIQDGKDYLLHFGNYIVRRDGTNIDIVYSEMEDIKKERDSTDDVSVKEKTQWLLDYYFWTISCIDAVDTSRFMQFTSLAKSRFKHLT